MVKRGTRAVSRSNMKRIKLINWKSILVALLVTVIAWGSWLYLSSRTNQAETIRKLELKQTELNVKLKELNQTQESKKQLELQKVELEKQLQAKKDTAVAYAESLQDAPAPKAVYVPAPVHITGSCAEWIAQAGVTDVANASWLIYKESGCNPNSINRSSGACGIAQELPCGKSGCGLGNAVCQIRWMQSYVISRYGSWSNAVAFHQSHNWY